MKIAVFSDIHANFSAFEAALSLLEDQPVDGYIFLGDLIGYLTHPRETIARFLALQEEMKKEEGLFKFIHGNHEELLHVAVKQQTEWDKPRDDPEMFDYASAQFRWIELLEGEIKKTLGKGMANKAAVDGLYRNFRGLEGTNELEWFKSTITGSKDDFEMVFECEDTRFHLVHGGVIGPARHYVFPWNDLDFSGGMVDPYLKNGYEAGRQHCILFGHTHIPTFARANFAKDEIINIEDIDIEYGREYSWDAHLVMINPGSIGLPRDGDRRPAFALLDAQAQTVKFCRIEEYDRDEIEDKLFASYTQAIQEYYLNASIPDLLNKPITPEYIQRFEKRKNLPGCEVSDEK
jgi:predicted phosphodiesterase